MSAQLGSMIRFVRHMCPGVVLLEIGSKGMCPGVVLLEMGSKEMCPDVVLDLRIRVCLLDRMGVDRSPCVNIPILCHTNGNDIHAGFSFTITRASWTTRNNI